MASPSSNSYLVPELKARILDYLSPAFIRSRLLVLARCGFDPRDVSSLAQALILMRTYEDPHPNFYAIPRTIQVIHLEAIQDLFIQAILNVNGPSTESSFLALTARCHSDDEHISGALDKSLIKQELIEPPTHALEAACQCAQIAHSRLFLSVPDISLKGWRRLFIQCCLKSYEAAFMRCLELAPVDELPHWQAFHEEEAGYDEIQEAISFINHGCLHLIEKGQDSLIKQLTSHEIVRCLHIKNALDIGMQKLVIPSVSTKEKAAIQQCLLHLIHSSRFRALIAENEQDYVELVKKSLELNLNESCQILLGCPKSTAISAQLCDQIYNTLSLNQADSPFDLFNCFLDSYLKSQTNTRAELCLLMETFGRNQHASFVSFLSQLPCIRQHQAERTEDFLSLVSFVTEHPNCSHLPIATQSLSPDQIKTLLGQALFFNNKNLLDYLLSDPQARATSFHPFLSCWQKATMTLPELCETLTLPSQSDIPISLLSASLLPCPTFSWQGENELLKNFYLKVLEARADAPIPAIHLSLIAAAYCHDFPICQKLVHTPSFLATAFEQRLKLFFDLSKIIRLPHELCNPINTPSFHQEVKKHAQQAMEQINQFEDPPSEMDPAAFSSAILILKCALATSPCHADASFLRKLIEDPACSDIPADDFNSSLMNAIARGDIESLRIFAEYYDEMDLLVSTPTHKVPFQEVLEAIDLPIPCHIYSILTALLVDIGCNHPTLIAQEFVSHLILSPAMAQYRQSVIDCLNAPEDEGLSAPSIRSLAVSIASAVATEDRAFLEMPAIVNHSLLRNAHFIEFLIKMGCQNDKTAVLFHLCSTNPALPLTHESASTLLLWAAKKGHVAILGFLLRHNQLPEINPSVLVEALEHAKDSPRLQPYICTLSPFEERIRSINLQWGGFFPLAKETLTALQEDVGPFYHPFMCLSLLSNFNVVASYRLANQTDFHDFLEKAFKLTEDPKGKLHIATLQLITNWARYKEDVKLICQCLRHQSSSKISVDILSSLMLFAKAKNHQELEELILSLKKM